LAEYRFNDTTFHSINYDPNWQVICFGTNKGQLLNYFIKVGNDNPNFDYNEDFTKKKKMEAKEIDDKNVSLNQDSMVFLSEYEEI
jgi:hypothetical protein